jgi:hypothetical protein
MISSSDHKTVKSNMKYDMNLPLSSDRSGFKGFQNGRRKPAALGTNRVAGMGQTELAKEIGNDLDNA